MKISKTVREFIEEKVYEKMPKPEKVIVYEAENELALKLEKEIKEKTIKYENKIRQEYSKKYNLKIHTDCGLISNINLFEAYEERQNYKQTCIKKIRDIIVELELGGTKADLDRLLNEIH